MREIKFRAWDGERIVDFGALRCKQGHRNAFENTLSRGTADYAWDKKAYTLMQYTGLKDRNGKEIYEGDILSGYANDYPIEVTWNQSAAGWYTNNNRDDEYSHTGTLSIGVACHVEVIGNTHENPELLK